MHYKNFLYIISLLLVSTVLMATIPTTQIATILTPTKNLQHFAFTSTNGKAFTNADLFNKWSLLFFGYSECPAICPQTLAIINSVWHSFPNNQPDNTNLIFISLDKRETIHSLSNFLHKFNPAFIGAVGKEQEVNNFAKSLGIFSFREEKNGTVLIDHSATIILVNPQGRLYALFAPPHDPAKIAADLKFLLKP